MFHPAPPPSRTAPGALRYGYGVEPLGVTDVHPRLSWQLPLGSSRQIAYRIRTGVWDSGRIESSRTVLVAYLGPIPHPGDCVQWRVKVWTDLGESDWSAPSWWEMGLLDPRDWVAQWVVPHGADLVGEQRPHPVHLLRGTFVAPENVEKARLYVTAHGLYEFFINGERVGDQELTPGFTSYTKNLHVQTFDVTGYLRPGQNAVGAVLSGGWVKWTRLYRHRYPTGLLAQLNCRLSDGSVVRFGTGPDWMSTRSAILTADLFQGQVEDRREQLPAWSVPGAGTEGWSPVEVRGYDPTRLHASPAPPVRRVGEFTPASFIRLDPSRIVIDFGQNINGWVRLGKLGPWGSSLTLTHGESLNPDGTVRNMSWPDNLWHETSLDAPFQQDQITSAGRAGDGFEPRHTTHGFQFVQLDGEVSSVGRNDIRAVVVHTDLRRTGWFECSDERLNRLHEAALWSFRGNACDIPTDCPSRERAGWTGDFQLFFPAAAYLYDIAGFSAKWLHDLAADQLPDGRVWHSVPNPEPLERYESFPPGNAGFGDAAVIVPWQMYRVYGDDRILAEQFDSMLAWVDYVARTARTRRHHSRISARPVAAPHEQFLWDTGYHWGEWNEPNMFPPNASQEEIAEVVRGLHTADHGNVATAFFYRSALQAGQAACVLHKESEAARLATLAADVRDAWQREFLGHDGRVFPESQANYVRALAFDLIPSGKRPAATARLTALIRDADTHLGTGFLATPFLLPVLAENGRLDLAYELLLQQTPPSWLYMIARGATTIWEKWEGLDEQGQANDSLNHYSKGAVISFLHQFVSGLRQHSDSVAYERVSIAPRPGGGVTWAQAAFDSPRGRIETRWSNVGGEFTLDLTLPPGSTGEVLLPDGQTRTAGSGATRYTCRI